MGPMMSELKLRPPTDGQEYFELGHYSGSTPIDNRIFQRQLSVVTSSRRQASGGCASGHVWARRVHLVVTFGGCVESQEVVNGDHHHAADHESQGKEGMEAGNGFPRRLNDFMQHHHEESVHHDADVSRHVTQQGQYSRALRGGEIAQAATAEVKCARKKLAEQWQA